jgi:hypothetical protein
MKKLRPLLVACALAGLTACGDAASPVAPAAPRYDGGVYTAGSGGRAGGAIHTDTTVVVSSSAETTTGEAPALRGTYTAGSGG